MSIHTATWLVKFENRGIDITATEIQYSPPKIEEYFCYRSFLNDFFNYKKANNSNYSHRLFSSKAGLKSSGHLKMVINRDRNIGVKALPCYLKGLGFTQKKDQEFFKLLVKYDQSKDLSDKAKHFENILKLKERSGVSIISASQFRLLSDTSMVTLYVLIGFKQFCMTRERIFSSLTKEIPKAKIEKNLNILLEMNLIENIDGCYKQTVGALSTPDDIKAIAVNKYHEEMILRSLESLKKDPANERNFNGVTIGIDAKKFDIVCEKINRFRRELNEILSEDELSSNQVYQLNLNFFPLTKELI